MRLTINIDTTLILPYPSRYSLDISYQRYDIDQVVLMVDNSEILHIFDSTCSSRIIDFLYDMSTDIYEQIDCHGFVHYLYTGNIVPPSGLHIAHSDMIESSIHHGLSISVLLDSEYYCHSAFIFLSKDGHKYYFGTSGFLRRLAIMDDKLISNYVSDIHIGKYSIRNTMVIEK